MALRLFEHNEKAYHATVRMMEQYGKAAYMILGEFHRAGAECWGKSAVALLRLCPDAKLLGLTATNIRYLDNSRDMAEERFGGHIATDVTIGEAVARGILPAPKYVTTVYQYQKTLAKYQARVDNLRAPGIQDVNQKYLDALRRALEQADGLDRVFAHHITNLLRRVRRPEYPETVYHARRAEPWCVAGHPAPCARRTESDRAVDRMAGQNREKMGPRPHRLELAQGSKRKSENLNVSANHKTGEDVGLCG